MKLTMAGIFALLLLVVSSGVAAVFVKHQSRSLFAELQELQRARDALDVEWSQLRLEQETWANHNRVERIATQKLDMEIPIPSQVVLVAP